jgi:GNAT superfamily N-acetyltransferase
LKITVLSDASAPSLVLAVLPSFASAAGISDEDLRRLHSVVDALVAFVLEHAYPDDELGEIELTLDAGDGVVRVVAHDWGRPLMSRGAGFGPLPEGLAAVTADARDVQLLNLGRDGKRLTAEVPVHSSGAQAETHHIDAAPRAAQPGPGAPDLIEVRAGTPFDAEAIAQLLYENYHLSYVHGDFYRPRYLMAVLEMGQLLSTVAVHEGRVVGHHGLMPLAGGASAETGAAVVHSAYRGLGVFGRMSEHTLEVARERGLMSVFGDAVTIHPFSQRVELAHGYREAALQLAMVPAQTTMRGVGGSATGRRTATLRSYRPFHARPREVALPAAYRDLLEAIYANLELPVGARTESPARDDERVTTAVDQPRALGFLRLRRWDGDTKPLLKQELRRLLALHLDVLYADVDLVAADPDEATAELNELGFFAAGLILDGPDGHDHLRLQLLDCEEVELDEIICDSTFADALRRRVLEDKARVGA